MKKTIGQLREEERYHGDPSGGASTGAGSRKFLDNALTSDENFMSDAVSDTVSMVKRISQEKINALARSAMAAHLNDLKKAGKLKKQR